ncbi:peptide/nickel transport system ATP-binding protein [Pseudarthrobacter sp. W1I19]|uniref:ABC transporter ATP-binding protein n=1 Tax=Pseudarthrobacter sp. W1I19 TaxID=3042288 RepID=UPI0027836C2C|nr:dipeptide/oligopeptide/nickel ABC transporter ATP-binding protein [Pseudarthrobacter sp. W1I19]MDQ0921713.1 peptide/nickel transport system ATP-binding protein [Pseudarthrobacter sp. W1I19]
MTGALSAHGISFRYARSFRYPSRSFRSRQPAETLSNVSLTLKPGAGTALVGSSGSGKSTLVRIMLGLAKPCRGTVTLDGCAVRPGPARSLRWYRRSVQYIPQNPAGSLDPRMTVSQLLQEPLRQLRVEGNHRDLAGQALDRVELPARMMTHRPGELSGGQNQRVTIARALAVKPAYLLADEPVSGLDLPLRDAILTLLDRLVHEGLGLLLVTHDLGTAARMCGTTAVLSGGSIAEQGPTDQVLAHPSSPAAHALVHAAAAMQLPSTAGSVAL